jgi:hypothetical protein
LAQLALLLPVLTPFLPLLAALFAASATVALSSARGVTAALALAAALALPALASALILAAALTLALTATLTLSAPLLLVASAAPQLHRILALALRQDNPVGRSLARSGRAGQEGK